MRIKGFTTGAVCTAFVCFAASAFAAQPAWELAPPDAKVLVGVDFRSMKNSPLIDWLTVQMHSDMKTELKQIKGPMATLHVPGIELLDDIDSVFVASNGEKIAARPVVDKVESAALTAPIADTDSFLVVLSGTFPDEHLRPLLKGPHPSYKGINVYRGIGPHPVGIAVLDEHLIALGDEKSIYRAIDRKTTGIKLQGGAIFERAKELAAANDIWIVVRDLPADIQNTGGPVAAFASEMEGLDFGLAARDAFNLNIAMATKTEAGAQMFAQLISSQLQSAIIAKMDDQEATEALKRITVSANGKSMQVQIAMSKEDLLDNMRRMQEQRANGGVRVASRSPKLGVTTASTSTRTTSTTLSAAVPTAPPALLKPRVIKIYGLDDGEKEIQLDKVH